METLPLLGSILGLGFLAGIRLYATVLVVGLGIRLGLLQLNPELSHLQVLADTRVLVAAGLLYLLEFFADKIPWLDSLWDSVHTLVRPLGAAALAAVALGPVDLGVKTIMALLAGGIALTGHSSKAATRLLVNHSPEPFTNVGLSLLEDLLVPFGAWLALEHPVLTTGVLAVFLALFFWLSPKIFRLVRVQTVALASLVKRWFGSEEQCRLPPRYLRHLESKRGVVSPSRCVRCVATKSITRLRNSIGYLCFFQDGCVFVTRRLFRFRAHDLDLACVKDVRLDKGIFLDRLDFTANSRTHSFYLFKGATIRAEDVVRLPSQASHA